MSSYRISAHTKNVSMKKMDVLLSDYADAEARALVTIMEAGKTALRSIQ